MSGSKKCFKCGKTKSLELFYKHPGMKDGRLGKCKECAKTDIKINRENNIDYFRDYDRKRGRSPARIKAATQVTKAWRAEDARRARCHNAVARGIKRGDIERKPCCVCGSQKSMAHHEDYEKPFEIEWYCQIHHKARHKEIRRK